MARGTAHAAVPPAASDSGDWQIGPIGLGLDTARESEDPAPPGWLAPLPRNALGGLAAPRYCDTTGEAADGGVPVTKPASAATLGPDATPAPATPPPPPPLLGLSAVATSSLALAQAQVQPPGDGTASSRRGWFGVAPRRESAGPAGVAGALAPALVASAAMGGACVDGAASSASTLPPSPAASLPGLTPPAAPQWAEWHPSGASAPSQHRGWPPASGAPAPQREWLAAPLALTQPRRDGAATGGDETGEMRRWGGGGADGERQASTDTASSGQLWPAWAREAAVSATSCDSLHSLSASATTSFARSAGSPAAASQEAAAGHVHGHSPSPIAGVVLVRGGGPAVMSDARWSAGGLGRAPAPSPLGSSLAAPAPTSWRPSQVGDAGMSAGYRGLATVPSYPSPPRVASPSSAGLLPRTSSSTTSLAAMAAAAGVPAHQTAVLQARAAHVVAKASPPGSPSTVGVAEAAAISVRSPLAEAAAISVRSPLTAMVGLGAAASPLGLRPRGGTSASAASLTLPPSAGGFEASAMPGAGHGWPMPSETAWPMWSGSSGFASAAPGSPGWALDAPGSASAWPTPPLRASYRGHAGSGVSGGSGAAAWPLGMDGGASSKHSPYNGPASKTRICRYYLARSNNHFGKTCSYVHPCKGLLLDGGCRHGRRCTDDHVCVAHLLHGDTLPHGCTAGDTCQLLHVRFESDRAALLEMVRDWMALRGATTAGAGDGGGGGGGWPLEAGGSDVSGGDYGVGGGAAPPRVLCPFWYVETCSGCKAGADCIYDHPGQVQLLTRPLPTPAQLRFAEKAWEKRRMQDAARGAVSPLGALPLSPGSLPGPAIVAGMTPLALSPARVAGGWAGPGAAFSGFDGGAAPGDFALPDLLAAMARLHVEAGGAPVWLGGGGGGEGGVVDDGRRQAGPNTVRDRHGGGGGGDGGMHFGGGLGTVPWWAHDGAGSATGHAAAGVAAVRHDSRG